MVTSNPRIVSHFKLISLCSLALSLGHAVQGAAQFPYSSDFEGGDGFSVGSLPQNDWSAESGEPTITDTDANLGSQSLSLGPNSPVQLARLDLDQHDSPTVASIECYAQMPAVDVADLPVALRNDVAAIATLVNVSANTGEIYVADGDGVGGYTWVATGVTYGLTGNRSTDWIRLVYRLDYTNDQWDLLLNAVPAATGLGFIDNSVDNLNFIRVRGDENETMRIDSVTANVEGPDTDGDTLSDYDESLVSADPFLPDTDMDGLWDAIEAAWGFNPAVSNSYDRLLNDGTGALTWLTGFESKEGFAVGALDGQVNWTGSTFQVTPADAFGDSLWSISLGQTEAGSTEHYVGASDSKQVHVSFKAQLTPGPVPNISTITEPTSALFTLNENNQLAAYDGTTDQWLTTVATYDPTVWRRYDTYLDYDTKTWTLSVDGVAVLQTMGFANNDLPYFSRLKVSKTGTEGTSDTFIDEVRVSNQAYDANTADYHFWAARFLGDIYAANTQMLSDFDLDGSANFVEFSQSTDPSVFSQSNISFSQSGGVLTLQYRKDRAGLNYTVEQSETLLPGSWVAASGTETPLGGGEYGYDVSMAGKTKLFLRLNVETQ